jgi:hypothetical protein
MVIFVLFSLFNIVNINTHVVDLLKPEKSLRIRKGSLESINRRRTNNTMAKRKSIKGQTTIYKALDYMNQVPKKLVSDRI